LLTCGVNQRSPLSTNLSVLKLLYSIILLLLCSSSFAQIKLSGNVSSSTSVAFAGVAIENPAIGFKSAMQTDTNGYYSFAGLKPGQYALTISYTGYDKYTTNINLLHDTVLNIQLQFANKQLKEVVIMGARQMISKSADKVTFNVSSSVTATGTDVLDAISKIPGVKVSGNEISVVGKGMVRVMVDNRLIQLSGEDLLRFVKSMAANQVSKIELITNPSARYEADGNAGLINIVTKQTKKQGYNGNLQLAGKQLFHGKLPPYNNGSNFWELVGSGNISYNKNRWSVFGSFNVGADRELEGFRTDVHYPNKTSLQSDTGLYTYHNFEINAGVDYKLSDKTTVGLSYLGGRLVYDGSDHVYNPYYNLAGAADSTLKTYATYHPIALTNSFNLHSVTKLDTAGTDLIFNADYFNYYRTDLSNFESNSFDNIGAVIPQNRTRYFDTNKQVIDVYTFKADLELPTPFAKFAIGSKLSFIKNYSNAFYYDKDDSDNLTYNTNLSNEFRYTENTQSVYATGNKTMGKWQLQAGVRAELTQTKGYSYNLNQSTPNNYFKLFPSLLVNYKANDNNSFALTVGRRINRPSFWNLNPFKSIMTAYSYQEGNPYLQPEFNTNIEVSHTYKSIFTTAVFLSITNNGFGPVTIARTDTNFVRTIPLNFINTRRFGLTESVALTPFTWWESNQQFNVYHTSATSQLPYINSIKGWGAYVATNNNFFLNKAKTFAAAANFWCQFPEVDHIGRSNTYYKLDVGIKGSVASKKLDIALMLNDALRSSASSVRSVVNNLPTQFTNFQLWRYVQLSVAYKFGNTSTKTESRDKGNAEETGRVH
jgi:outer membrane receptor protein involved in Fe transport